MCIIVVYIQISSARWRLSLSRDLFFGPTDQREVIIEFLFTRMVTDIHGSLSYHEFSNYSLSHGESRNVTGHEFANYRIFLHTEFHRESRIYISCHEFANSIITSRWSVGPKDKSRDKEKHPWSSVIIRVIKKNSTIRKFVI